MMIPKKVVLMRQRRILHKEVIKIKKLIYIGLVIILVFYITACTIETVDIGADEEDVTEPEISSGITEVDELSELNEEDVEQELDNLEDFIDQI